MKGHIVSAPPLKRLKAFGFDYLLIALYLVILLLVGVGITAVVSTPTTPPLSPITQDLIAFLTTILPVTLYFSWLESSPKQASWGKQKMGLQVVNSQTGQRLSLAQALARSLLKFLPWQMAHTSLIHIPGWPFAPAEPALWVQMGLITSQLLILLYILLLFSPPRRRTPYDFLTNTQVIESKPLA